MSAEWVTALGTAGTFVVISVSAGAALVQLRHMRSSNQIVSLNDIKARLDSELYRDALRFVRETFPDRYDEPEVRRLLLRSRRPKEFESIGLVANFFEELGVFVRLGYIDREITCAVWGRIILDCWSKLEPFISNHRRAFDHPEDWTNFEYVAVMSRLTLDEGRMAAYPPRIERMPLSQPWSETLTEARKRHDEKGRAGA